MHDLSGLGFRGLGLELSLSVPWYHISQRLGSLASCKICGINPTPLLRACFAEAKKFKPKGFARKRFKEETKRFEKETHEP